MLTVMCKQLCNFVNEHTGGRQTAENTSILCSNITTLYNNTR